MYRPKTWSYAPNLTHIYIDVAGRQLTFYYANRVFGPYPVGVGKASTPTPVGNWSVAVLDPNPWWEVLGTRWIGLSIPYGNYRIHGTNADWSIGGYVSNGCIRMHKWDVATIYPYFTIRKSIIPSCSV